MLTKQTFFTKYSKIFRKKTEKQQQDGARERRGGAWGPQRKKFIEMNLGKKYGVGLGIPLAWLSGTKTTFYTKYVYEKQNIFGFLFWRFKFLKSVLKHISRLKSNV